MNAKFYRIHIMMWILFIIYEDLISLFINGKLWTPVEIVNSYFVNILIFYVNAHFILPYSHKKPFYVGASLIILALIVSTGLKICIYQIFYYTGLDPVKPLANMHLSLIMTVWRFIYFLGLSTGYWFALNTIIHRKEISDLEKNKLLDQLHKQQLEKKLADSEIAYLKSQINPHFLFNTLNFLYNNAFQTSAELATPILLLSDIMRYALTETQQTGKVELDDEIEQVKTFIELNQFRFDHNLQLSFDIYGDTEDLKILPLILLTPVENIFKYGDLKNPEHPAKIRLEITENQLYFNSYNRKLKSKKHIISHGVGLENLKMRLDAYYPDAYHIRITDHEDNYTFELEITL